MSARAVVVAHRESLAAEGIAAALAQYPSLVPVGVATTAADAIRHGERADAVAIDERLPGADMAAARLRRCGVRVVVLGEGPSDEDGGVRVPAHSSVASLAAALAPGLRPLRPSRLLTPREREVLSLAAKGMAAKQIARALEISPKTVEQHKTRLYRKLGVPNQAAAVATMMAQGGT